MNLTYKVALEIAHHEALVREAYKDGGDVWTWSIGVTSASGHNVKRYIDNPQSIERCLEIYVWLLKTKYAPSVRRAFKGHKLTDAQFAAALSYHWNTGAISKAPWVRHFKRGDMAAAKKSMQRSRITIRGRRSDSLAARRKKEVDLFFSGKWSATDKILVLPVTKSHRPYWKRGRQVNIERELRAALKPSQSPIPDHVPVTPKQPQNPVTSKPLGIGAALALLAGSIYAGWDWLTSLIGF